MCLFNLRTVFKEPTVDSGLNVLLLSESSVSSSIFYNKQCTQKPSTVIPQNYVSIVQTQAGTSFTLIPSGLTSRILTCTELKGHCFVLVSGYVC